MPERVEKTISFEALALASMLVCKRLIMSLISQGTLGRDQVRTVFNGARADFDRSTLPCGAQEVNDIFSLIWPDYGAAAPDIKKH